MDASLANFVISGKFSFADFTKSILSDMAKIASRQASSALLGTLVGAATNYFTGSGTGNGLAAGSAGAVSSNVGASQSGYTSADFSSFVSGARATGGDVSPNSLYQVNELGPELLSQGGKTYLMTGEAGGSITPTCVWQQISSRYARGGWQWQCAQRVHKHRFRRHFPSEHRYIWP
ncbi:hypothetical protein DND90_21690 [Pseudomonas syringae pv. maculicola]|nr:hypothetical protein DND90_21690 [Pseudomonas syringae pv. maculicola]